MRKRSTGELSFLTVSNLFSLVVRVSSPLTNHEDGRQALVSHESDIHWISAYTKASLKTRRVYQQNSHIDLPVVTIGLKQLRDRRIESNCEKTLRTSYCQCACVTKHCDVRLPQTALELVND